MTIAQPLPQPAYSDLPIEGFEEQAGLLKSESQACKGGNVMVEDPTPSIFPSYSSSFSLDNFVAYTFPDIAMDLDSFA